MNYARDGYAIVPLFGADEVEAMRAAVSAHIDRVARALFKPYAETAPEAPFDERLERIAAADQSLASLLGTAVATDAHRAPAIAGLARDERLEARAAELAGLPISQKIARMRLNCSALTGRRQGWHSDAARLDDSAAAQLVITGWIPLSDAGQDSGGLEFVPGRRGQPLAHGEGGEKFVIDSARLAGCTTITPEVPAGHCLFMDRFTPHRALENRSGRTRWSLVVWMKAEGVARLPGAPD